MWHWSYFYITNLYWKAFERLDACKTVFSFNFCQNKFYHLLTLRQVISSGPDRFFCPCCKQKENFSFVATPEKGLDFHLGKGTTLTQWQVIEKCTMLNKLNAEWFVCWMLGFYWSRSSSTALIFRLFLGDATVVNPKLWYLRGSQNGEEDPE